MPKLTIGQLKAELSLKPSARSAAFQALVQQVRAIARLSPEEISRKISSGELRLPRFKIPSGDPDRFSSDWDQVRLASPEPLTRTEYLRFLRGESPSDAANPSPADAEIDHVVMSFDSHRG